MFASLQVGTMNTVRFSSYVCFSLHRHSSVFLTHTEFLLKKETRKIKMSATYAFRFHSQLNFNVNILKYIM